MSDRIAVMYLGEIVEHGTAAELFEDPRHPYTEALLAANPDVNAGPDEEMRGLEGTVPDPANPPQGCRFHTRCPVATPICGWEVDDVVQWLSDSAALPDTLSDVERRSDFDATLVFDDEDSAARVAATIDGGTLPAAMATALHRARADGNKLEIRFEESEPVNLVDVSGGHLTSCVLHTGAYDEKTAP